MSTPSTSQQRALTAQTIGIVSAAATVVSALAAYTTATQRKPLWIIILCAVVAAVIVILTLGRFARTWVYKAQYLKSIRKCEGFTRIKLIGATGTWTRLNINDIHIDVKVAKQNPQRPRRPSAFASFDESRNRFSLTDYFDVRYQRVFGVEGWPGSGKTTMLRWHVLDMARKRFWYHRKWPIILTLARHTDAIVANTAVTLAELVLSAHWLRGQGIPEKVMEKWLRGRSCVIMLDGLDEVPGEHRGTVATWISENIDRSEYGKARWFISSRPHGFDSTPLNVAEAIFEICPLTRDQIRDFVFLCYEAMKLEGVEGIDKPAKQARHLMDRLNDLPYLMDLAATPLLLHLIVVLHHADRDGLPHNRSELYDEFVKLLVDTRRKAARLASGGTGLDERRKRGVMQALALWAMMANRREFDPYPTIADSMAKVDLEVDPTRVINELCDNGLLVKIDHDVYTFAHLSFQEYLAAQEITAKEATDVLVGHIDEKWWRLTIVMWAAENDPSPVIQACLRKADGYSLRLAVECAHYAGRELDPNTQSDIAELWYGDHEVGSHTYTVACETQIRWGLGETISVDDDSALHYKPVAEGLYRLFLKQQALDGYHASTYVIDDTGQLHGLWPEEVGEFIAWIQRYNFDDFAYRLPERKEVSPHVVNEQCIWIADGSAILPKNETRAPDRYTAAAHDIEERLRSDWVRAARHFDSATASSSVTEVLRESRLLHTVAKDVVKRMGQSLKELQTANVEAASKSGGSLSSPDDDRVRQERLDEERILRNYRKYAKKVADRGSTIADKGERELDLLEVLQQIRTLPAPKPHRRVDGDLLTLLSDQLETVKERVLDACEAAYQDRLSQFTSTGDHPGMHIIKSAMAMLAATRPRSNDFLGRDASRHITAPVASVLNGYKPVSTFPDDVLSSLHAICTSPEWSQHDLKREPFTVPPTMAKDILEMLTPMLKRQAPLDLRAVASACIGLFTAAVLLPTVAESARGGVRSHLQRCLAGLTVLELRATGKLRPDEAIVLVRQYPSIKRHRRRYRWLTRAFPWARL